MKKLINAPADVTRDMLAGIALADAAMLIDPDHRIVVRADYAACRDRGLVALISGGGSGHEPAHAGYIGEGMLTAAVAGEVFTSPGIDAILAAIRLVTGEAGCLLIVKNYTGDRLNFGVAAAIARGEGLKVAMVLVDEDVAIAAGKSRAGARGLAGTVLVHKVAGAAAAAGATLEQVEEEVRAVIPLIGTMGVGLSSCTVPAAGTPGFALGKDEVEYGLGIHGEPGVTREAIVPADAIARRLVDTIVDRKGLLAGDPVVLLVNGLGGTPPAELAIVGGSAIAACRAHGLEVRRVMIGSFLTALEMAGASITLLRADDAVIARLEAPSGAPAWGPLLSPPATPGRITAPADPACAEADAGPTVDRTVEAALDSGIRRAAAALIAAEPTLTALDAQVGDGDLGISMMRAGEAVIAALPGLDLSRPSAAIESISGVLRRSVGGTSGPLYAAFALAVAHSLRDDGGKLALDAWARAFRRGCQAITDLGGADRGDRTMLDALLPAADALRDAAAAGLPAELAIEQAAKAARDGTADTARLDPRFGRSSYVGERAIGHVDPGAQAVTIWLHALSGADNAS